MIMENSLRKLVFQFIILSLIAAPALNIKPGFASSMGDYPGKWYGWHCPEVDPIENKGMLRGDAFPEQTIIASWGYKADPVDEIKDLIPEAFYEMVNHPEVFGFVRINETAYIHNSKWPGEHIRLRNEATEKYKGQPTLDEKGHIRNYRAGIPFPGSTDGLEIAWNFVKARNYGEKQWADFIFTVIDKKGGTRHIVSANSYFWFNGHLYDDTPCYGPNPNNYDFFHTLGYKAPYDFRGTTPLTYRYNDPDKQDDMWMYLPALRRTRRMATSQRWDRYPGGVDWTWDNATGFQGKPTNYEWKYLGQKEMLCGHNSKWQTQQTNGLASSICDQQYQRVNAIVLEYRPKIISTVSRVVMYLDPDSYQCYYAENYDKRGRLWLFLNNIWSVDNMGVIYPMSQHLFDVQRDHATACFVTDTRTNRDVTHGPEFFSMDKLKTYFGGR